MAIYTAIKVASELVRPGGCNFFLVTEDPSTSTGSGRIVVGWERLHYEAHAG